VGTPRACLCHAIIEGWMPALRVVVGQLSWLLMLSLKNVWLSLSVEVRCGSVPLQPRDERRLVVVNIALPYAVDVRAAVAAAKSVETSPACTDAFVSRA